MNIFFVNGQQVISYEELIKDINDQSYLKKYIKEEDPYEILKNVIISLVYGEKIELLDSDFTNEEIKNLGISADNLNLQKKLEKVEIQNFDSLLKKIKENSKNWEMNLYTSGTTGRPKKVKHKLETIARSVKTSEEFKNNVWVFAYNPTHFAGLQVFFQAFFNKNPMIYIFDADRTQIQELLQKYKVTHISATPTFYRSVLPYLKEKILSVERITMGGEKYDASLENQLSKIFPNAQIRNVYASTEAGSIFSAKGDVFHISPRLMKKIKIEGNELLIHKSLMGESDDLKLEGDWYRTGDVVEKIDNEHFRFISRKTEMINIGGYKVNPHEVEEAIKSIPGIIDAVINARNNKITGSILTAQIVVENNVDVKQKEKEIIKSLRAKLQSWKIPRIIEFVNEIKLTRTGKKVRK
jgi:acyl-coenzyme A synthetase/AMP-(fatty) acid ligase